MTIVLPPGSDATFLDLQDQVLDYGFGADYRTRVKSWLNEAQQRIARSLELRELLTSTSISATRDTSVYSLPTDFVRIAALLHEGDGTWLEYQTNPHHVLAINQSGDTTGVPTGYTLASGGLLLTPVPDNSYTLTLAYYKRPTTLVDDTDVPLINADYYDLMVTYALSRAYRAEDDAEMSQFYMQEYQRDLAQMATDRQFESLDGPRQIGGMWY